MRLRAWGAAGAWLRGSPAAIQCSAGVHTASRRVALDGVALERDGAQLCTQGQVRHLRAVSTAAAAATHAWFTSSISFLHVVITATGSRGRKPFEINEGQAVQHGQRVELADAVERQVQFLRQFDPCAPMVSSRRAAQAWS